MTKTTAPAASPMYADNTDSRSNNGTLPPGHLTAAERAAKAANAAWRKQFCESMDKFASGKIG